jgi:hypothetical protein
MSDPVSSPSAGPSSLPLPAYTQPVDARRRIRLQRLPQGNFNLVFESEGRSGYPVIYASVPLGAGNALTTLMGLAALCAMVDARGLPGAEVADAG